MSGEDHNTPSATDLPRSQDMQEVIGTPPGWLARYGTISLLLTVVILAFLATAYRYPAVVTGPLTLTTIDPPRPLRAPQDFRIAMVRARHKGPVEATQALVVAESEANFPDVFDLTEALNNITSLAEEDLAAASSKLSAGPSGPRVPWKTTTSGPAPASPRPKKTSARTASPPTNSTRCAAGATSPATS